MCSSLTLPLPLPSFTLSKALLLLPAPSLTFILDSSSIHSPTPAMVSAPIETPSKVAAAQLDQLDLSKPASLTAKLAAAKEAGDVDSKVVAQRKQHKSAQVVDELQDEGRDRFVGNPDITCDADEPILKENGKRFVLFPIQYHEVSAFDVRHSVAISSRRVDARDSRGDTFFRAETLTSLLALAP